MQLLSLSQYEILKNFLADPDGQAAIRIFLDKERRYHEEKCTAQMLVGEEKSAVKSAHFANVYGTVLPELRHFTENQNPHKV